MKSRKRIFWQLYPSYLVVVIVAVGLVAWYAVRSQHQMYLDVTTSDLRARAQLIEFQVDDDLAAKNDSAVSSMVREIGRGSATRITVVGMNGVVLGDSEEDPATMENHGNRPEIVAAVDTGFGSAIRYSNTLQIRMLYVAVLAKVDGRPVGIIRTSMPLTFINGELAATTVKMVLGGLVILVLAAIVMLFVSRRISRPLEDLRRGAERFAAGELHARLLVPDTEEIGTLAEAMNRMAQQLDQRINTITRQGREQDAILTSMVEGVVAVDTDARLLNLNQSAAQLLDLDPDAVRGRIVHEVVRNTKLQQIIDAALQEHHPVEAEIVFTGREDRFVNASATILRDAEGQNIGAVVVLDDVTKIRRLESLRREFVANVSHELKTPITSIMGSVETLLDGAAENAEDSKRFLTIIDRQADRLMRIVDDLLSLSRIERESDEGLIELSTGKVSDVIKAAVEMCEVKASERSVRIDFECDPDLRASMNAPLLEQALVNLLDNSIKYSEEGTPVRVVAKAEDDQILISVEDHGRGIPEQHLARIFERFYRVDHARSRKLGGTGLGLAIVKHIAIAHRGKVSVKSKSGEGSTFTISLPRTVLTPQPGNPS